MSTFIKIVLALLAFNLVFLWLWHRFWKRKKQLESPTMSEIEAWNDEKRWSQGQ